MMKIEECSRCNSIELIYKEQYPVFNPDTDEEELHNAWICTFCNTVHVNNSDYQFYMIEIQTDKTLQLHDNCTIV